MSNIEVDSQKISGSEPMEEPENSESEIELAAITHCQCDEDGRNTPCMDVCNHAISCNCGADSSGCDGTFIKGCQEEPFAQSYHSNTSKKNWAYCLYCNYNCNPPNQVSDP